MAETRKVRLTRRWLFGEDVYGPADGEKPMEVELPAHLADIAERLEKPYAEAAKAERAARRKDGGQG